VNFRPFRPSPLKRAALLALLVAALPLATSAQPQPNTKAARFYEDALVRYEKKDLPGAIIQLKNALQADKNMLPVHVLLGKALLENGDVIQAEVAFTEALRLGVNRAEVVVPLAQALVGQGRPDEVLSNARFAVDGLPRGTQYQILLLRAGAATEMADVRTGLQAIDDARAIDPADPGSWIAEVPIRIRAGQLREALVAADKAISLGPASAEAHYSRGEALHVVPNLIGALASYGKALALDPSHVPARIARAGIQVDQNRLDAAARDLAEAEKTARGDPRTLYLKSVIAERQGRTDEARALLNEITALLDPIPPQFLRYRPQTQMLGGMAHHGLGQREKARPYLEGVLRQQPGHPVSKVLASIYMADRNNEAAIDVLTSYTRISPGDGQALLLLASAQMAQGRHARATQIMQDALKFGDQPQLRTALGLSLVGSGRFADAIKEFEAAYAKDPKQLPAGYTLASMYVQSGQAANAARVAEAVSRAHPGNPGVLVLLGSARRLQGNAAGARSAYQSALTADPRFVAAHLGLARIEIDANALPSARERLNQALALGDKNLDTLMMLAEVAERGKQLAEAQRWLLKAEESAAPNDVVPVLALVDFHLRHNQLEQARDASRRALGKDPEAVRTLIAVARVALAEGDAAGARPSLLRAATAAGFNVPLLTQIAQLQNQAGAPQAAAHSLDKALGDRPDYLPAQALRTDVDIRLGDLAAAEQRARQILARNPRLGLGHTLLGNVASARGQLDAAIAAYRQAHEIERSTESLARLFAGTLRRDRGAAIKLAEQWLAVHPKDAFVWRALADTQLTAGNLPAARRSYEALVQLKPDDADALNNLANVLLAQKDPGALRLAEQALALAPGEPHIIGTTGWAAFQAGQTERAVQMLRDARLRDPGNADTRYFLGTVLASLGRKTEAREELTAAVQSKPATNHRDAAEQLLATLR
jgi:putative PEP-CTERM system TPR-repeat lipoprotein